MGQEEEIHKCSNSNNSGGGSGSNGGFNVVGCVNISSSSSSNRSSKKQKQKKIPQRGLGVAQLEKIRLEEQQKKDGSIILPPPPPPLPVQTKNSNFSMPIPNYQISYPSQDHHLTSSSSPNSILRPQSVDTIGTSSVSLAGWQPKMWNCDLDKESCCDAGLAFRSPTLDLPFESKPIWPPLSSLMQRSSAHENQQQPPPPPAAGSSCSSSLMVNNVSSPGSSSSLVLNFYSEPPSNQNCYGPCIPAAWPEEEKMVGMKRPYPFSLETSSAGPSNNYSKFPPIIHPITRSDDSASYGHGGGTFSINPSIIPSFRSESLSRYNSSNLEHNSKKSIKEINGDFLTLAPPTILKTCPSSKVRRTSTFLAFDFDSLPYQGNVEDPIVQPAGQSVANQQQTYYSFLPTTIMQTGQATMTINNCNGGEVAENIDLNLRL